MSNAEWLRLAREFGFKPTSMAARATARHLWSELDVTRHLPQHDVWWLQQVAEIIDEDTKPLIDALAELLPELGWRGSGPNARNEYYCEFCGDEAIKRGKPLVHTGDCLVTKAHSVLERFKREEQTDVEQPSTRSD